MRLYKRFPNSYVIHTPIFTWEHFDSFYDRNFLPAKAHGCSPQQYYYAPSNTDVYRMAAFLLSVVANSLCLHRIYIFSLASCMQMLTWNSIYSVFYFTTCHFRQKEVSTTSGYGTTNHCCSIRNPISVNCPTHESVGRSLHHRRRLTAISFYCGWLGFRGTIKLDECLWLVFLSAQGGRLACCIKLTHPVISGKAHRT